MAWFYRGASKIPTAHWFDPGAEVSLCTKLRPDSKGVAWRHPVHDQHIGQCKLCHEKLSARKKSSKDALQEDVEPVEK
jgi:hypothetical protein